MTQNTSKVTSDRPDAEKKRKTSSNSSLDSHYELIGSHICQVIIPVALCSLYVVTLVRVLEFNVYRSQLSFLDKTWKKLGLVSFNRIGEFETKSADIFRNLVLVSMIVVLVVIVTLLILLIFYMRWHKCLMYYFYLPSFIIMAVISPAYMKAVSLSLNWFALDLLTFGLFVWNFVALGMMAVFGLYVTTPLYVQQFYLIHNSAILSVLLVTALPGWAPWFLLCFLVVWDLFAVMAPIGPLRLILRFAEREGIDDMPGLIYTTEVKEDQVSRRVGAAESHDNNKRQPPEDEQASATGEQDRSADLPIEQQVIESKKVRSRGRPAESAVQQVKRQAAMAVARANHQVSSESLRTHTGSLMPSEDSSAEQPGGSPGEIEIEEEGVNIGLGDFIFYGLLVGLSSRGRGRRDYYATLVSFESILVGLVITLIVLRVTRRAVPALPVSIGLGLVLAPLTAIFADPLSSALASSQVFI